MKILYVSVFLFLGMISPINVYADEPNVSKDLLGCTTTNGKHLQVHKNGYQYSYTLYNKNNGIELRIVKASDNMMRDFSPSMTGYIANLYFSDGDYMYTVQGSEDKGGWEYGVVYISKNGTQLSKLECDRDTVKSNMSNESLVGEIDIVD
jgi:hypothetical protein